MKRCAALTKGGGRCQRIASDGSGYCYSHDPAMAEERRRNAQRAGQAGGRGRPGAGASAELATVKAELRDVIADVRDGSLDRGTGAVIGGLYNTLLRALEVQRRWYEADVLEARIEALEAEREQEQGGSRWRA
jgi:hypothetical protein